ncbi:MAG: EVE domain-containing protein [Candidatus Bathyarchaeota archaeon]|nr:EVE domain-containing protein [Candidatus Bathyarchaeota archaeon]MDH5779066.1 EVE domain-containing protein [Candidatus Bathyarchaeota archaeon]
MKYWLCVTDEDNWQAIKEKKVWGVPAKRGKRQMEAVERGDCLVIYVKPKRIGGIFEAASEPYESSEKVFSWAEFGKPEIFPYRVRLKPVRVPNEPVHVGTLMDKLSFTKGIKRWGIFLRRAMFEISEKDYGLILSLIARK